MYSVIDSVYCLAVLERRHLQSYQDAFSVRWGRQGMRWWSHTRARSASGSYLTPSRCHFRHMTTAMVVHWWQVLLFLLQHPYLGTRGIHVWECCAYHEINETGKQAIYFDIERAWPILSSSCTDSCRKLCVHTTASCVSHVSRPGWSGCIVLTYVCICCVTWHHYFSQL